MQVTQFLEEIKVTNDPNNKVKTSVEVDEEIWRKLRAYAAEKGLSVSKALEEVLAEYFGLKGNRR